MHDDSPRGCGSNRPGFGPIIDWLLPRSCLECGRPAPPDRFLLCARCRGNLSLPPRPGCQRCGRLLAAAGRPAGRPDERLCGPCRLLPGHLDLAAGWSYEGPLVRVVHALKFRKMDFLGPQLGRALAGQLGGPPAEEPTARAAPLLVPIPLHWIRRLVRGYNQADLVARGLAEIWGLERVPALRRVRRTPAQARLGRSPRRDNLRRAFAVPVPARIAGRHVLLVDDVVTTGSTLRAAAAALGQAGASRVSAVVVARTPDRPTRD